MAARAARSSPWCSSTTAAAAAAAALTICLLLIKDEVFGARNYPPQPLFLSQSDPYETIEVRIWSILPYPAIFFLYYFLPLLLLGPPTFN